MKKSLTMVGFLFALLVSIVVIGCVESNGQTVSLSEASSMEVVRNSEGLLVTTTTTSTNTLANNQTICTVRGACEKVTIVGGRETASGVPTVQLGQLCKEPEKNRVDDVVDAMHKSGFDRVHSIAVCDDKVGVEEKKVALGGKTFIYKAINYTNNSCLLDRVGRYSLITEAGIPATPLEELLLVLEKKIPYNAYAGRWLPNRRYEPCAEYGYKQAQTTSVDTVMTLPDGRIIKHIVTEGSLPYFAVETIKKIKVRKVEIREVQGGPRLARKNRASYRLPSEAELRSQGVIPEGWNLEEVHGITAIEVDGIAYDTQTIEIVTQEIVDRVYVTCYPYNN